jgi:hypothetical protein
MPSALGWLQVLKHSQAEGLVVFGGLSILGFPGERKSV